MLNLATGYEQGKDYFEWWNCSPLTDNDDEKRIALRCAFAGNFLYIPLDENGDMLPYDTDKTEVTMANLYYFGSPANDGYDAWTPTGDPNKPVKLESDGIPDGVIIMLPLGPEEEDDEERDMMIAEVENEFFNHCIATDDRLAFSLVWWGLAKKDWEFHDNWIRQRQFFEQKITDSVRYNIVTA